MSTKGEAVAIIGMSCLFPEAKNLREYWENILNKRDCIKEVPSSHWSIADYWDPDPLKADKTYCKHGGFIPEIDFYPMDFGIPPNLLETTDVAQLLGVYVAKKALEDAGYFTMGDNLREKTGIILGVSGTTMKLFTPLINRLQYPVWKEVLNSCNVPDSDCEIIIEKIKKAYIGWNESAFPGFLANVVAGRIANRLDIKGTSYTIDAACASSLAAIQSAVQALQSNQCDMVITGGVDTDMTINNFMAFTKTPTLSKSGKSRPFDEDSDGIIIGEGLGMFILKRLSDAERDNDRIYAVVKGMGSSSDGKSKSIYAPDKMGQIRALKNAYENAGITPDSIQLVEAHGTGTNAGDAEELAALNMFFNSGENDHQPEIALGSIKSQIGHLKCAAGAAGMMKVALALYHKIIPSTINVQKPKLKPGASKIYINTDSRPWIKKYESRRAGVSAFGFGGTNFHFVLEEYKDKQTVRLQSPQHTVILYSQTLSTLISQCTNLIATLTSDRGIQSFQTIIDLEKIDIPADNPRLGFICSSKEDAVEKLNTCITLLSQSHDKAEWSHPKGIYYYCRSHAEKGKVVAMFSGQGAYYLNMGKSLCENYAPFQETFAGMDRLFEIDNLNPLSDVVYPPNTFDKAALKLQEAALQHTEYSQAAIGSFCIGLYKMLKNAGFSPDIIAGHSFGEISALYAAGALTEVEFLKIVKARGRATRHLESPSNESGGMLAIKSELPINIEDIKELIKEKQELYIANINSNHQVVIGGKKENLNSIQSVFEQKGYKAVLLNVSAAFHTPLVRQAAENFKQEIQKIAFTKPNTLMYSNLTGRPFEQSDEGFLKNELISAMCKPVLFKNEIEEIYKDGGYFFIEFGPRNVLSNIVKETLIDKPHLAVSLVSTGKKDSDLQLREALMHLRVAGLPLKHFDTHSLKETIPEIKKGFSVKLNGSSYVTDQTKICYADALKDNKKLSIIEQLTAKKPAFTDSAEMTTTDTPPVHQPVIKVSTPSVSNADKNDYRSRLSSTNDIIQNLAQIQNKNFEMHSKFLENYFKYSEGAQDILRDQQSLIQKSNHSTNLFISDINKEISSNISLLHKQQNETLRVHELFLNQMFNMSKDMRAAPSNTPDNNRIPNPHSEAVTPSSAMSIMNASVESNVNLVNEKPESDDTVEKPIDTQISKQTIDEHLLLVVSEKTGYPFEMLSLAMNMEADLGIDSLKKVEIMGALKELFPQSSEFQSGELNELQTLSEVSDVIARHTVHINQPNTQSSQGTSIRPKNLIPTIQKSTLETAMLTIVSEKTGYPMEMLSLGMSMEADLGVDSLKKVEIMGALRESFPFSGEFDTSRLSELQTLQEVSDTVLQYLSEQNPGKPSKSTDVDILNTADAPLSAITKDKIERALLEVVSEKTGYPLEMLEMDMDMEADLGIDSLKKVEIMGALRERYPESSDIDSGALNELQTLRQISETLAGCFSDNASIVNRDNEVVIKTVLSEPEPVYTHTSNRVQADSSNVKSVLLNIISEKTGYPVEMLEPDMNLEADLGIDSLKKVEIMGALRENFPILSELPTNDLNEILTIKEIINQVSDVIGKTDQKINSQGKSIETNRSDKPDSEVIVGNSISHPPANEVKDTASSIFEQNNQTQDSSNPNRIRRFGVKLKTLPPPDRIVNQFDSVCVVIGDNSDFSKAVASKLKQQFQKIVFLAFPGNSQIPDGIIVEHLQGIDENEIKSTLDKVNTSYGTIGGVVCLFPEHIAGLPQRWTFVKSVFFLVKHSKEYLKKAAQKQYSFLMAVTKIDGKLGFTGNNPEGYIEGSLSGLIKSVNQEWNSVICRFIDISPDLPFEKAAECVTNEILQPDRYITEVGCHPEGRFTLDTYESTAAETKSDAIPVIDKDSVILVSGGAKGITSECVIALAKEHKCRFVLLGRTELDDSVQTDVVKMSDAEAKKVILQRLKEKIKTVTPARVKKEYDLAKSIFSIQSVIDEVAKHGGSAHYFNVDVNDEKALLKKLTEVRKEFGDFTGFIHGAGVLADKLIEKKSEKDLDFVYKTKVDGLINVVNAIDPAHLKFVVLFSSVSGFYGSVGQTDYAMANESLNKFAYYFETIYPSCKVVSVNWGPWDSGMVTPEIKKAFEQKKIGIIGISEGTRYLTDELDLQFKHSTQVIFSSPISLDLMMEDYFLKKHTITLRIVIDKNPFLYDHVINGRPVLPAANTFSWIISSCEGLYPGYRFIRARDGQVLNGIICDEKMPETFILELNENSKNGSTIEFNALLYSYRNETKRIPNYKINIELSRVPLNEEILTNYSLDQGKTIEGATLYNEGILFHGPAFQGIKRVLDVSKERFCMECYAREVTEEEQGQFFVRTLNPYLVDISYQGGQMLTMILQNKGALPAHLGAIDYYRPVHWNQTFYASAEVLKFTESTLACNFYIHDKDGKLYWKVMNGAGTIIDLDIKKRNQTGGSRE